MSVSLGQSQKKVNRAPGGDAVKGFNFVTSQPFANACDEAAGYGDTGSFNALDKGAFTITDN
jgi:hypothetical protein